jgi:hypothetical protein
MTSCVSLRIKALSENHFEFINNRATFRYRRHFCQSNPGDRIGRRLTKFCMNTRWHRLPTGLPDGQTGPCKWLRERPFHL